MSDFQKIEILFKTLNFVGIFILFGFGYFQWKEQLRISKRNEVAKHLLKAFIDFQNLIADLRRHQGSHFSELVLETKSILHYDIENIKKFFKIQKETFFVKWDKVLDLDGELSFGAQEAKIVLGVDFEDQQTRICDAAMKIYAALISLEEVIEDHENKENEHELFYKKFKYHSVILGLHPEKSTDIENPEKESKIIINEVCEKLEPFLTIRNKGFFSKLINKEKAKR